MQEQWRRVSSTRRRSQRPETVRNVVTCKKRENAQHNRFQFFSYFFRFAPLPSLFDLFHCRSTFFWFSSSPLLLRVAVSKEEARGPACVGRRLWGKNWRRKALLHGERAVAAGLLLPLEAVRPPLGAEWRRDLVIPVWRV